MGSSWMTVLVLAAVSLFSYFMSPHLPASCLRCLILQLMTHLLLSWLSDSVSFIS